MRGAMPARIVPVAEQDRCPIEIGGVRHTALDGDTLLVTAGARARAMSSRIAPVLAVSSPLRLETVYLRQVTCGTIVFGGGKRGPDDLEACRVHVDPDNTLNQPPQLRRLLPGIVAVWIIRCGAASRASCRTICHHGFEREGTRAFLCIRLLPCRLSGQRWAL
jgi:hypothetical protein